MRKKNGEDQRNTLDIILTDLQPVETPEIYTLGNFYTYLIRKKSIKYLKKKNVDPEKGLTCSSWHAAPLKYYTLKDNHEYREMSYINPLSMIEVCLFLDQYQDELLHHMQRESFSIRNHKKRSDLIYKYTKKQLVAYGSKIITGKEATGDFYEIYPYSRLDLFYKSLDWFDLNRRYSYYGKLDYSKCFDSIYTHTFNWIIADTTIDAKEFNQKHYLSAIDRLLQNMNMSITNGIVVGPEFSRFLAEIILQAIDADVINQIKVSTNYKKGIDYDVKRYVDDIFIFAQSEEIVQTLISAIKNAARKFRLQINHEKQVTGKLPHVWSEWLSNINNFQKYMIDCMFYSLTDNEHNYLVKERNISSVNKIAKIKELFQSVVISDQKMNVKIVSYCLSTIYNKIRLRKNDEIIKTIFHFGEDNTVYCFYDLIFYIYSFATTYKNTEKLISIIYTIEREIGENKSNTLLKKVISRYDFLFINGNIADIANLILLCTFKKINIGTVAEQKCLVEISQSGNPMSYALFFLYDREVVNNDLRIGEKIEQILNDKIELLKLYYKKVFLSPDVWWIFVFYGCPYLSPSIKTQMENLFINVRNSHDDVMVWNASKIEVLDFFLDNAYKQKFINWEIERNTFYKNIVFKTFERTIFNNNANDELTAIFEYV